MTRSYDPRIDRRADQALKRLAQAEIEVAKALVPLHQSRSFTEDGSSNVGQYAERRGVDARQAWRLFRLGQALCAKKGLEKKVREGEIPPANAAQIGKVLSNPTLLEKGDDWEGLAATGGKKEVEDAVQERIEKKRQKTPRTYPLRFFVSKDVKEAYERLRKLLSRKKRRSLTPGQVLAHAIEAGLAANDTDRKPSRKRRAGPTNEKPQSRYVPAAVKRALRKRSGDACEFPGCENEIFLEKSHGYPKRRGGGQELDDLADLCSCHHKLRDRGELWQVGWTSLGKPVFQHKSGEVHWPRGAIRKPRTRPPDRVAEPQATYRASRRTKAPPGRSDGGTRSRETRAPPEGR